MTEKELDLFDLATSLVAEPGTSPTQIVWCQLGDSGLLCDLSDNVPDDLCRHPLTPDATVSVDPAKDLAARDPC